MQKKTINLYKAIKSFILIPGFFIIIGLLLINIIDRFVLNGLLGLMWVEEVTVIILIWLIFLSAIIIDKDRSHIRISLFNMPEKFHQILEDIAMIAFLGFLVWSTWELLPKIFSRYAATGWSIKVGYYAIIFGSSLAILGRLAKYLPKRFSKWF